MSESNSSKSGNNEISASSRLSQPTAFVIIPDGSKQIPLGSGVTTGILGEGGMAIVYEIWNEQLGIKRAIKLLKPNSSPESRKRFYNEVKITAQLDHPYIIRIHTFGEWNGLPYIEMDRIDGFSLEDMIRRHGALPLEVSTAIGIIIAKALDYTHYLEYVIDNKQCVGLLHRDLKPANILISKKGIVRLTDFGIAIPTYLANKTDGKVIGSMQYLAPEQLEEKTIDNRADIFSFGCIMYEMITGVKAFPEKNITRLIRKRLKNDYVPLHSFNLSLPLKLNNLISQCIELNPNKRPLNIREVLDELIRIHKKITVSSPDEVVSLYVSGKNINNFAFSGYRIPLLFSKFKSNFVKYSIVLLSVISVITMTILFTYLNSSKSPKKVEKGMESTAVAALKDSPSNSTVQNNASSSIAIKSGTNDTQEKDIQNNNTSKTTNTNSAGNVNNSKQSAGTAPQRNKSIQERSSSSLKEERMISIIEKLQKKYNTDDIVEILKKEDAANRYESILSLYNYLPFSISNLKEIRLLRHRALVETKQITRNYFDETYINDGEFLLSKAKFFYSIGQHNKALTLLGIIGSTPVDLMSKKTIENEVVYYSAKCATAVFMSDPSKKSQDDAMKSWFDVKKEFRDNQNHPYFVEANKEIRNINKIKIN